MECRHTTCLHVDMNHFVEKNVFIFINQHGMPEERTRTTSTKICCPFPHPISKYKATIIIEMSHFHVCRQPLTFLRIR